MGLAQVQAALAQLAVDPSLRDRFFSDTRGVGISLGLSADDAESLAAISRSGLEQFADSLKWKRREQVRRMIPESGRVLGREFPVLFQRYLDGSAPRGSKADLDDAVAFVQSMGRGVGSIKPEWVVELACYELAWRQAARAKRLPIVRLFRYPVQRLISGPAAGDVTPGLILALWWRWTPRGTVRHALVKWPGLSYWARLGRSAMTRGAREPVYRDRADSTIETKTSYKV
jgi:hypothetical protein